MEHEQAAFTQRRQDTSRSLQRQATPVMNSRCLQVLHTRCKGTDHTAHGTTRYTPHRHARTEDRTISYRIVSYRIGCGGESAHCATREPTLHSHHDKLVEKAQEDPRQSRVSS